MADRKKIEALQNQVITLKTRQNDVRAKLEEAALRLYEVRLRADAEPYHRLMLDTVRSTLDKCVKALR